MAADIARRWLGHVRRDLNTAWTAPRGPRADAGNAAYFLQQAAEKLIKGTLVIGEIRPPKTHDLTRLAEALPNDHPMRQDLLALDDLTAYAVAFRYPDQPDVLPEPSLDELDRWVERLEELLVRAERLLAEQQAADGS